MPKLIELTAAHGISGVPVLDGSDLVGIVTRRDLRFESDLQKLVSAIMTPKDKLVTVKEGRDLRRKYNCCCTSIALRKFW